MKIFLAGASGVTGRSLVPQGPSLMRPGYPETHRGCQDQQSSGADSRHFDQEEEPRWRSRKKSTAS